MEKKNRKNREIISFNEIKDLKEEKKIRNKFYKLEFYLIG